MTDLARLVFEKVAAGELQEDTALALLESLQAGSVSSKPKDIAIIGLSMRMPGANTLEQFWHNLSRKQDQIGEYPLHRRRDSETIIRTHTTLSAEEIAYSVGGYLEEVDKFDYSFFQLSPMEAALMDPNQRMFLESCWSAIEDAGYGGDKLKGSRTGVYIGHADWPVYGQYITKTQPSRIQLAGVGNTPSILASRIAYLLDLRGPSLLIDTACSSSLVAVHTACKAIQNGDCDMAITGGVKLCLMPVAGVFEIGIESSRARTSAFDEHSDGTVWGEGAAALLLKPLDQAMADRDHIYAVIKGSAMNQDGASVGITAPNAAAQEDVLCRAWTDAGVEPDSITLFEAHGTGTRLGDPIEFDGIQRAFRRYTSKKQFCAIGSVKTNIGHLDGLSGIAGLLKGIAALRFKQLPPTLHFARPNRNIPFTDSPVYVQDRLAAWEAADNMPRRCGVSSFGFSGTNCHVILEEAPEPVAGETERRESGLANSLHLLPISAKSGEALQEWAAAYAARLRTAEEPLADICFTASTGRGHYAYRLAVIGKEKQELVGKLEAYARSGRTGEGVYAGVHRPVAMQREIRTAGEVTPSELRAYSRTAGELLVQLQTAALEEEQSTMLQQLAEQYILGAEVDWAKFFRDANCRKVSLPTYPFRRMRCWVDDMAEQDAADTQKPTVRLTGRASGEYDAAEQLLGQAWGELLGLETLDIYDDFFEIGGNSIQAIRLETDLSKLGIALTAEQIEADRCIKRLAERLAGQPLTGAAAHSSRPVSNAAIMKELHEQGMAESAAGRQESANVASAALEPAHAATVIPGIDPFNEVFFKNCFYNSLFPVVRRHGESVLPIMLNELIVFAKEGSRYEVSYVPDRPDEEIFAQVGLQLTARESNAHIIAEIQDEVASGHPVIVWVDAFELSIRKDAYRKEHMDHTLLIYGCDVLTRQFHVIEHDRRENLSYRHQLVSYGDLERGCQSFMDRYVRTGQHAVTHYWIRPASGRHADRKSRTEEQLQSEYVRAFAAMLSASQPMLAQSESVLAQFVAEFEAAAADEAHMKARVEEWADFLNQVMNSKQVELYRLRHLLGEQHEIVQAADRLRKNWDTVRKGVVRFFYLPAFDADAFHKLSVRLQELLQQERHFREQLLLSVSSYLQTT